MNDIGVNLVSTLQTEDEILNLRSLLKEVVVMHPEDGYSVVILVEVKATKGAFMLKSLQEQILMPLMPREFWGLVEFWSEESARLILPGVTGAGSYG